MIKDMTGKVFGRLTVLCQAPSRRENRAAWLCRCSCGNECIVTGKELREKKTKSCGCLRREQSRLQDISGQHFGRLTAVYPTSKRDHKGSVIWMCRCSCGNTVEVTQDKLISKSQVSCGCKRLEHQKNIYQSLHYIDGTCVEFLQRKKRSDNTSGYIGISVRKNGMYRAHIGFKGKRYYLGSFKTLDEAIQARSMAEEKLHKPFLSAYHGIRAGEHADEGAR